jgi:hypothetical protein
MEKNLQRQLGVDGPESNNSDSDESFTESVSNRESHYRPSQVMNRGQDNHSANFASANPNSTRSAPQRSAVQKTTTSSLFSPVKFHEQLPPSRQTSSNIAQHDNTSHRTATTLQKGKLDMGNSRQSTLSNRADTGPSKVIPNRNTTQQARPFANLNSKIDNTSTRPSFRDEVNKKNMHNNFANAFDRRNH